MNQLLHAAFLRTVDQYPNKIALVCGNVRMTYKDLYEQAKVFANYVSRVVPKEERLVGVLLQKGWQQVVVVLGILMAGGVYVPLDVNSPRARTIEVVKKSNLTLLITTEEAFCQDECVSVEVGFFEDIVLSDDKKEFNFQDQDAQSLAYVIFTSGSTGVPKGVAIQHFAAMNTISDVIDRFNISESDIILGLSELNFDLSVFDIFGIFAVGGKLVLPTSLENRDPKKWLQLIQEEGVTIWNTVPAFLSMFYEFNQDERLPNFLRLFLLSGDWIPLAIIKEMKRCLPNSCYVSLGGATEASIWSVSYQIDYIDPEWTSIPYGRG